MATSQSKTKNTKGKEKVTAVIKKIYTLPGGALTSIHPIQSKGKPGSFIVSTDYTLCTVSKENGIHELLRMVTGKISCFAQSMGITAVSIPGNIAFLTPTEKGNTIKSVQLKKDIVYLEPWWPDAEDTFMCTAIDKTRTFVWPSGETRPCDSQEADYSPTIASLDTALLNTLYCGQCGMIQIIQMDILNYRIMLTSKKSRFAICWDEQKLLIYDKALQIWQPVYQPGITCATITSPDEFHVGTSGSEIYTVTLKPAKTSPARKKTPLQKQSPSISSCFGLGNTNPHAYLL